MKTSVTRDKTSLKLKLKTKLKLKN
jgi:hypothetical protein